MVGDKIKKLREENGLTQAELGRKIGITRSSVNAWEMGISIPSTQYIVELANIFKVSTDYLLNVSYSKAIDLGGLSREDIDYVYGLVNHLRNKNRE